MAALKLQGSHSSGKPGKSGKLKSVWKVWDNQGIS